MCGAEPRGAGASSEALALGDGLRLPWRSHALSPRGRHRPLARASSSTCPALLRPGATALLLYPVSLYQTFSLVWTWCLQRVCPSWTVPPPAPWWDSRTVIRCRCAWCERCVPQHRGFSESVVVFNLGGGGRRSQDAAVGAGAARASRGVAGRGTAATGCGQGLGDTARTGASLLPDGLGRGSRAARPDARGAALGGSVCRGVGGARGSREHCVEGPGRQGTRSTSLGWTMACNPLNGSQGSSGALLCGASGWLFTCPLKPLDS